MDGPPIRFDPEQLQRRWVHSHEEDRNGVMVFRPAGYAFPPSRGRRELDLEAQGRATKSKPGPTDRRTSAAAEWEFEAPDKLVIRAGDGGEERFAIHSVGLDRMELLPE